jgi:hypothetical protein
MKNIDHINGLTVESVGDKRVVKYSSQECPLIKRDQRLCDADTSYRGDVLDSWETYQTPVGVVERHYWARGAGLERSGVSWRIVPTQEIAEAQERFETASRELTEARTALEKLVNN